MKAWEDAKKNIRSLSPNEIEELEAIANAVSEAVLTDVKIDHTTKIEKKDYVVLKTIERDCPICNKIHFVEERKRSTQAIVKGEIVDYEEVFYCCTTSDEEESEFVSAGLMDENLSRARNAYIEQRTGVEWKDVQAELLSDPVTAKAVKYLEPEYEIIRAIIEARINQGLTQEELAKRIGTRQSNISRLEAGEANPSLRFLKKLATGLGKELHISFK